MASISKKMTILDIVAIITIPLIGVIGYLVNDKMNTSNIVLEEIRKEVNAGNVRFENHEGRISRNTTDIQIINDKLGEK